MRRDAIEAVCVRNERSHYVRRFADLRASRWSKHPSSRPCVRSSQLTCERNANVRNRARKKDRCVYTHNIYFFFHIYLPSSHAFANSHDCLAAQMLCASRAGARARVRGRGRTLQAKEGNDALVSTERPTADHSTTRLADESTPPRRLFQLFSEQLQIVESAGQSTCAFYVMRA